MSTLTVNANEITSHVGVDKIGIGDKLGYRIGDYKALSIWDINEKVINKIEKDNQRIIVYDVQGIPENMITVKTKFENRTKSMYVCIDGDYHDEYLEIKREIHEKIYVNTDAYSRYNYKVCNGLLILRLYEKMNKMPDFKKMGE